MHTMKILLLLVILASSLTSPARGADARGADPDSLSERLSAIRNAGATAENAFSGSERLAAAAVLAKKEKEAASLYSPVVTACLVPHAPHPSVFMWGVSPVALAFLRNWMDPEQVRKAIVTLAAQRLSTTARGAGGGAAVAAAAAHGPQQHSAAPAACEEESAPSSPPSPQSLSGRASRASVGTTAARAGGSPRRASAEAKEAKADAEAAKAPAEEEEEGGDDGALHPSHVENVTVSTGAKLAFERPKGPPRRRRKTRGAAPSEASSAAGGVMAEEEASPPAAQPAAAAAAAEEEEEEEEGDDDGASTTGRSIATGSVGTLGGRGVEFHDVAELFEREQIVPFFFKHPRSREWMVLFYDGVISAEKLIRSKTPEMGVVADILRNLQSLSMKEQVERTMTLWQGKTIDHSQVLKLFEQIFHVNQTLKKSRESARASLGVAEGPLSGSTPEELAELRGIFSACSAAYSHKAEVLDLYARWLAASDDAGRAEALGFYDRWIAEQAGHEAAAADA